MNNIRDKFEAWFTGEVDSKTRRAMMEKDDAGYYKFQSAYNAWNVWQAATEQSQKEIAELEAKLNELVKFQSSADRLAKAQAESLNTIAELKAREKVLVEAISISLNCIREEINLNNYTETLLGDFISDYGDMVTILQYALANVRGEVK